MKYRAADLIILTSLAVICLAIPGISAAVPGETRPVWPIITSPELNTTGTDIVNHSVPSRYEIQPTLFRVEVEISETSLPGPKGEMAAGPRTIGFSADPVSLMIVIVLIIAVAAGGGFLVRRKPEEEDDEINEIGNDRNGE